MTISKKDFFLAGLIGFLFGLLLLPVLKNLKVEFLVLNFSSAVIMITGFTVFAMVALWVASLIGRRMPVILQFAKFGAVGALNTLLDLGVLNALIYLTGIAAGGGYILFKSISFIIANANAYFWNKYWTFGSRKEANAKEFGQFFAVSVIGLVLNAGTASLLVNYFPLKGFSAGQIANIGAFAAVLVSLIWNFIGYKFIVFKDSELKPKTG